MNEETKWVKPCSVSWFTAHRETIFDWLDIPRCTEHGKIYRAEAAKRIAIGLSGERIPDDGRYMGRLLFAEEMVELLKTAQYKRPEGCDRFATENLKSYDSLKRAWDFCISMARGYVGWKSHQSEVALMMDPASELIRTGQSEHPRDWPAIWNMAGGKFHGEPSADYPSAPGRMMALTTDVIWVKLSRFGVPWPPFEIGSGIRRQPISRREALGNGLIVQGLKQKALTGWWDFEGS